MRDGQTDEEQELEDSARREEIIHQASADLAAYFQARPALRRILEALLEKYQRNGRAAGVLQLKDPTEAELEAIREFTGVRYTAPVKIKAATFEGYIAKTRFADADWKETLERTFHTVIQTRREQREEQDTRWETMLREAADAAGLTRAAEWLEGLRTPGCPGRLLLSRALKEDPRQACIALQQALGCLRWLEEHPGQRVRLAVLSADVTTDPHALDGDTLTGRLLIQMLAWVQGVPTPGNVAEREELFLQFHILLDSISSTVAQVGLILETETGEHPAWQALRLGHEIATLTPANLNRITSCRSPSGRVYCVENQMVFSQLTDHADQFHSPLVCTSGQPSAAALRLLDLLAKSGTQIYYAGDFDGKGLDIAAQMAERYGDLVHLWRLTPEDYERCCSEVPLTDISFNQLSSVRVMKYIPVAEAVRAKRLAGYQERLLEDMLADLTDELEPVAN